MVHLKTAQHYLDKKGENKAATGGSEWKNTYTQSSNNGSFFLTYGLIMKRLIGVTNTLELIYNPWNAKDYETVSEAVTDLVKQGYTFNFSISEEEDCIVCKKKRTYSFQKKIFEIDAVYRFEGMNDPGDSIDCLCRFLQKSQHQRSCSQWLRGIL